MSKPPPPPPSTGRGAAYRHQPRRLEVETAACRSVVWRFSGSHRWWMWGVWPRHASNSNGEHGHSRWRWLAVRRMRRALQRLGVHQ